MAGIKARHGLIRCADLLLAMSLFVISVFRRNPEIAFIYRPETSFSHQNYCQPKAGGHNARPFDRHLLRNKHHSNRTLLSVHKDEKQ